MGKRKILVTSALPYANGDIHLGHLVEHIQTDIWVRFQKAWGHECYYVCADDTHGTPVMLAAEKAGISPEALVEATSKRHRCDFKDFLIGHDEYYSTNSIENKLLLEDTFERLRAAGKINVKTIEQLFDPEKKMFLPDRFVKGECPNCHSLDQYGDNCEVCGATYATTDLINPYSTLSGERPILKKTQHYFFTLSHCRDFLRSWVGAEESKGICHVQKEARNKLDEWLQGTLQDWDITRDAPYFGFRIPGNENKYFYVWLDAPLGYMASFQKLCEKKGIDFNEYFKIESTTELYHFIGKDILYFHALFWPAVLHYAGYRTPSAIFAHGFLTINRKKMSKSRGTFVTARAYLDKGLKPEALRYYIAAKLNSRIEDIDLSSSDLIARVNSDLVGKYVNIAARAAGFIEKRFQHRLLGFKEPTVLLSKLQQSAPYLADLYERRDFSQAVRQIMELSDQVNSAIADTKPWTLPQEESNKLHRFCSEILHAFRLLTIYLAPIVPQVAAKASEFLRLDCVDWQGLHTEFPESTIGKYQHLIDRIPAKEVETLFSGSANEPASWKKSTEKSTEQKSSPQAMKDDENTPELALCSFEDFTKIRMQVGRILKAEKIAQSQKLLKFHVDFGKETRTIFSGVAAFYPDPEALVGRLVIAVTNLPPRKMASFGVSEGMILSASGGKGLYLLSVESGASPGMEIG